MQPPGSRVRSALRLRSCGRAGVIMPDRVSLVAKAPAAKPRPSSSSRWTGGLTATATCRDHLSGRCALCNASPLRVPV